MLTEALSFLGERKENGPKVLAADEGQTYEECDDNNDGSISLFFSITGEISRPRDAGISPSL
jgi:hypothetical protein